MANVGDELGNLDFESMIGGPLIAVIKAQTQAAIASADFIQSVGFKKDEQGKLIEPFMVSFVYDKPIKDKDGNIVPTKYQLTVPLLTMLPIPFIRIEETTIDFNAKITAMEKSEQASSHELKAGLEASAGWGAFSAKLSVNYAYKQSSSSGSSIERTYSMAIHVKAVQDELPAGTERLLAILEKNIAEAPAPADRAPRTLAGGATNATAGRSRGVRRGAARTVRAPISASRKAAATEP